MTKPFDPHAKDWKDHLARLNLSPIPEPRITPAMVSKLKARIARVLRGVDDNGTMPIAYTRRDIGLAIDAWATRENKRTK